MLKNKWILIVVAIVIVAAAVTGGLLWYSSSNNYVATVGNEKIKATEYKYYLFYYKTYIEQQQGLDPASTRKEDYISFWKAKTDGKSAEDALKDTALNHAWQTKIQYMKAKQANITPDTSIDKNIDDYIDDVVSKSGKSRVQAEKDFITRAGVTFAQFKAITKDDDIARKYQNSVMGKMQFTDDQLKAHYDKYKDMLSRVTVRHILIPTQDLETGAAYTEDQKKAAETQANALLAKVNAGEDMEKLAADNSKDPSVTDNKGLFIIDKNGNAYDENGTQINTLVKEFPDWSFGAARKVGDAGIVKTTYGYHVIKLEKVFTFDELKANVKASKQNEEYSNEMMKWKDEAQYKLTKNQKEFDKIKVINY